MTLWRIHTRTDGRAAADYCKDHNVVGIGWPVPTVEEISLEQYWDLAAQKYPGDRGLDLALTNLAQHMLPGDLCWMRGDKSSRYRGTYLLGRVLEGEWSYVSDEASVEADTCNVRPCEWIEIGDERMVPGLLPTRFIRGQTLSRIKADTADKANLVLYSKYLWNKLSRQNTFVLDKEGHEENWAFLLSYKDLEELLALYLQFDREYAVLSTTWRHETPLFEVFLCGRRKGMRDAAIQVKTGAEILNYDSYSHCNDIDVYLCNSSDTIGGQSLPFVHQVLIADLLRFAEGNIQQLPPRYQGYLEIWRELH